MKIFKITIVVILIGALINTIKNPDYPILQVLPGLGGQRPLKYQIAGIVVICIAVWLCHRLNKNKNKARSKKSSRKFRKNQIGGYDYRDPYYRDYRQ